MLENYPITLSVPVPQSDLVIENSVPSPAKAAELVIDDGDTKKDEVVDVKSYITRKNPEYRQKKMMLAFNGIRYWKCNREFFLLPGSFAIFVIWKIGY